MDYDPWGNPLSGSATGERSTFNDQERDGETGLFDLSDRNYDAGIGAFSKPDRLWEKFRAVSPYNYCDANPVRLTDPTGMQTTPNAEAESDPEPTDDDVDPTTSNPSNSPSKPKRETLTPAGESADPDPVSQPQPLNDAEVAKTEAARNQANTRIRSENHNGLPPSRYQPGRMRVDELKPLHSPETSGARPDLEKLSDDELLEAARNPKKSDPITVYTNTGTLRDGNGRALELLRRAFMPNSIIMPHTTVPVVLFTPDLPPYHM